MADVEHICVTTGSSCTRRCRAARTIPSCQSSVTCKDADAVLWPVQGLRDITKEDGALLCFDEVMTGFRIAKGCAQEHFGITPDLTTLGKIIGGGLPVGAYGGSKEIMRTVAPAGPMYQVPPACAYRCRCNSCGLHRAWSALHWAAKGCAFSKARGMSSVRLPWERLRFCQLSSGRWTGIATGTAHSTALQLAECCPERCLIISSCENSNSKLLLKSLVFTHAITCRLARCPATRWR